MAGQTGAFVWHELLTTDVDAAIVFYSRVVGWTSGPPRVDDTRTMLFKARDEAGGELAAVAAATPSADRRPAAGWVGYIGVDDLGPALEKVVTLGGRVRSDPELVGSDLCAIASDPQGAIFGLLAPSHMNAAPGILAPRGASPMTWRELYTSDPASAFDFYAGLFGWQHGPAFDMGPAGPYQLFCNDGPPCGGIMRAPASMTGSGWNPFIHVPDIRNVASRVTASGGQVFDDLREAPGGDFTVKCIDPEGSIFAMTGRQT